MKKQDGGSIWYEGYCIDLIEELAKLLKFTYEIYPSPDGFYGAETENGTWDGMIGELISKVCKIIFFLILCLIDDRPLVVDRLLKGGNKRGREFHSVNFVELLINVIFYYFLL